MASRKLAKLVTRRETSRGTVESAGQHVFGIGRLVNIAKGAARIAKEIPRMQAYGEASSAIFRNVEVHRQEHFTRLADLGIEEEDPEKGTELLEHVKHVAEAYGAHRSGPLQREILIHVRHVEAKRSKEMLRALGAVAKHLKEIDYREIPRDHADLIARALQYARGGTEAPENLAEKRYVEWMMQIHGPLKKYASGQREEAIRELSEIVRRWRSELA